MICAIFFQIYNKAIMYWKWFRACLKDDAILDLDTNSMQSNKFIVSLFYKASSGLLKARCNQIIAPIFQNKFKLVKSITNLLIIIVSKQVSRIMQSYEKTMRGIKFWHLTQCLILLQKVWICLKCDVLGHFETFWYIFGCFGTFLEVLLCCFVIGKPTLVWAGLSSNLFKAWCNKTNLLHHYFQISFNLF